jgi:large conductance mechanosensitive channel
LVKKIFLPPLAFVTDNLHYQDKRYILKEAIRSKEGSITEKEIAIYYGELFEVTLDFLVVGLTIFIVVKGMNRLKNKSQDVKDKTVETPKDIELLTNLNKLMAEQNALLKALKQ